MCSFDRCTTVPCSLLALLPFPAFDTNAHTCSFSKCDKRITWRVFVQHQTPTPYSIKHLAHRNWRNVIPTFFWWCCPSNTCQLWLCFLLISVRLSLLFFLFFMFIFHLCRRFDTQCMLGTPLESAKLRSHPRRLQYTFHCPALYDSFTAGKAGCVFFFFFYGLNPNSPLF